MALLFPPQGRWTEQEYLALDSGRQIEFDRGCIEVLDMPTKEHQSLVRFLFLVMQAFVSNRRSIVLVHCLIHFKYAVDTFTIGQIAHSRILNGFSVGVDELFEAAKGT